jgi:hypothetical protein
MPHKPGHKNGRKSPTKPGQRFFGDVDAGRSKQDRIRHLSGAQVTNAERKKLSKSGIGHRAAKAALGGNRHGEWEQMTNAEKKRISDRVRRISGAQATNAELKRYLRGRK